MGLWLDLEDWRRRRGELIREAQERALAREARKVRRAFAALEGPPVGFGVRWGTVEDETTIAGILELNGMPRWVAFEERFIVAEKGGKVVGFLRYRTESKKLLLGLLVVDPWAGERKTAKALYAGARELAEELGAREVVAATPGADYPRAAGYRRFGRRWFSSIARPDQKGPGGWRRLLGLWGAKAIPFHRTFR